MNSELRRDCTIWQSVE